MKRKNLLVLSTAVLLACAASSLNIGEAMSNQYMREPLEESVQVEFDKIMAELTELGYDKFKVRQDGKGRATTYYSTIILPHDWETWKPERQLRLLRHEAAHARQWHELGVLVFGAQYVFSKRKRWVFEMHGYRSDIRDRCHLKHSRESIVKFIEAKSKELPGDYKFSKKNHKLVEDATREVLMKELAFCEEL